MSQTSVMSLLVSAGIALGAAGSATAEVSLSPDEIRAMVAEMNADANTRSSLLQSGGNAGHDGKFFLGDSQGNFRLNVGGQVQFRYIANFTDNGNPTNNSDDFTGGFQNRRTKLIFDGHVINKDIFYKVQGNFSRNGGNFGLQDAYVGYKFGDGWELKWGQFKAPFLREELVSSARQLTVERSLTNELFTGNRTQGIELAYKAEDWRAFFSFNDGFNAANTDFTNDNQGFVAGGIYSPVSSGGEADFGFTGRAEFKLSGEWGQFRDFTSMPGSNDAMMLGVAGHIESNESLAAMAPGTGTADVSLFNYTVDFSWEGDGWNFFAAFIGSSSDFENLADLDGDGLNDDASFNDYGVVVQGGMFIPDTDWEVFARYDAIFPDSDRSQDDAFNTITFGANWYWAGHAAKFTIDAQIHLDESLDDPATANVEGNPLALSAISSGIGSVGSQDDTEVAIRAQFQLLF